jgi:hypothetical protein
LHQTPGWSEGTSILTLAVLFTADFIENKKVMLALEMAPTSLDAGAIFKMHPAHIHPSSVSIVGNVPRNVRTARRPVHSCGIWVRFLTRALLNLFLLILLLSSFSSCSFLFFFFH